MYGNLNVTSLQGILLPAPQSTRGPNTDRRPAACTTRVLPIARRPYHEPAQRHNFGRMDQARPHRETLHWLSERSTGSGSSDPHPPSAMCCDRGRITKNDNSAYWKHRSCRQVSGYARWHSCGFSLHTLLLTHFLTRPRVS